MKKVIDLSTLFLPREASRLDRLVTRLHGEAVFARLPDKTRRKLSRRRSLDFYRAEVTAASNPANDYELASSRKLNCVFVHVPKAAGISVTKAIFGSRAGGHLPLRYYLWLYGAGYFDRAFKFTFVREPVSRARSAYQFLAGGGITADDAAWAERHVRRYASFDAFVQEALPGLPVRNALHFRPQVDFLTDPRTGKIGVDFIGRVENMQQDFETVAQRLKIDARIGHDNRQRGFSEDQEVSKETVRTLHDLYRADYEALGY